MGLLALLFVSLARAVAPTYTPVVAYGPTNYPDALSNMNSMRLQQNQAAGTPLPSTITDSTGAVTMPVSANTPAAGAVGAYVHVVSQPAAGGGTSSSFNAAFPATGTAAGFFDGTKMQSARIFDLDTGAGVEYALGINLRLMAPGGSIELGTLASPIRTDPTGSTIQPISGTVTANAGTNLNTSLLALESGGNLASIKTNTDNLDVALSTRLKAADILAGVTALGSITSALPSGSNTLGKIDQGVGGVSAWKVDGSAVTQPVSAASLPLPSGAATEATLALIPVGQASTTSGESGPLAQGATTTGAPTYVTGKTNPLSLTTAGSLRVDASGTTQPVSGTVTANIGTTGGLALDATLTGGTAKTKLVDTGGVNEASVSAGGAVKVDGSAVTQPVSAVSLPLPSGAATEATLALIPLGQGSTTSGQSGPLSQGAVTTGAPTYVTGKTDPLSLMTAGALRVDASGSTQPVSGTVSATQGTSPWVENETQLGGVAIDLGNGATGGGTQRVTLSSDSTGQVALASGSNTVGKVDQGTGGASAWKVDGSAVTQPISAAALPLPSGASTEATLALIPVGQASTTSGQSGPLVQGAVTTGAPTYVTGKTDPLSLTTTGALRVDGSGVTQPISAASLPLPTGASQEHTTAASPNAERLSDGAAFYDAAKTGQLPAALVGARLDTNTGAWLGSVAPTVGSKTSANSVPVVIASDQGAVAVSGTVAATQGTSPWVDNVTQFGSTNISTGTGASGAGIPRVTVSNDSSLAANQSVNTAQFGGTNISTGTGAGGAGIPRVTISNDSSLAANQSVNIAQIAGTTSLVGNGATGAGSIRVTQASDSTIPTTQDRATLAGSISTSAGSNVALVSPGTGSAVVQVTGAWAGTLRFQATVDGTNWFSINGIVPSWGAAQPGGSFTYQIFVNGAWILPCAGYAQVRVLGPTEVGTATVSINASSGTQAVSIANPSLVGTDPFGLPVQVRAFPSDGSVAVTDAGANAKLDAALLELQEIRKQLMLGTSSTPR